MNTYAAICFVFNIYLDKFPEICYHLSRKASINVLIVVKVINENGKTSTEGDYLSYVWCKWQATMYKLVLIDTTESSCPLSHFAWQQRGWGRARSASPRINQVTPSGTRRRAEVEDLVTPIHPLSVRRLLLLLIRSSMESDGAYVLCMKRVMKPLNNVSLLSYYVQHKSFLPVYIWLYRA